MLSNKNIELLIAKIDDGVKLAVKSVLEKNKVSTNFSSKQILFT